jgi:hypothetical protein
LNVNCFFLLKAFGIVAEYRSIRQWLVALTRLMQVPGITALIASGTSAAQVPELTKALQLSTADVAELHVPEPIKSV